MRIVSSGKTVSCGTRMHYVVIQRYINQVYPIYPYPFETCSNVKFEYLFITRADSKGTGLVDFLIYELIAQSCSI